MYVLSNSFLRPTGEYHVEVYYMELLTFPATVQIELKIFDAGLYMATFEITRADEKTTYGSCMNRPTKEEMLIAVEEAVIFVMEDTNHYWE